MQKKLTILILLLALPFLGGCRNPLNEHGENYSSRIHAIYADNPKTTLLFFGEKYQYTFPHVDGNLATLLEKKDDLGYTIGDEYAMESLQMQISILADGTPYLVLFIQFDGESLTEAQRGWLIEHGFEKAAKSTPGGEAIYSYNKQLNGKRYRVDSDKLGMLISLSGGTLLVGGRDFSYEKNPQVSESTVIIGVDDVQYKGRHFSPLPF